MRIERVTRGETDRGKITRWFTKEGAESWTVEERFRDSIVDFEVRGRKTEVEGVRGHGKNEKCCQCECIGSKTVERQLIVRK